MKKSTVLFAMTLSALVFSCKKDDDKPASEKIIGKWSLISGYSHEIDYSTETRDTVILKTGDRTADFRTDGKVVFHVANTTSYDTSLYVIVDGKLITTSIETNPEIDTFKINSLSGSDMQLYYKYSEPNYLYEETDNYKK